MAPQVRTTGGGEHSHWGLLWSTADWSTNFSLVSRNLKDPTSEASTVPPKTFFHKEGLAPREENTSQQKAHSCVTLLTTEAPLHSQSWRVENTAPMVLHAEKSGGWEKNQDLVQKSQFKTSGYSHFMKLKPVSARSCLNFRSGSCPLQSC